MTAPFPSPTKQWHTDTYKAISPSRPELSLKGKVVVVTGGGAGIGARTTRSFAEAGAAHIAILGRRKAVLESTAAEIRSSFPNTKIHTFSADITDKKAIDKVFHDFSEAVGKIDVLVSNAAAGDVEPSIKDLDPEAWFSIVETNIKGPLVLAQAFLAYGKEDGVIINVTSGLSFLFGPGMSAYCVSKEAAVRFFQIVGMENPKLRVVHVQPGVILTDMNKKSGMPAQDESKSLSSTSTSKQV